MLLETKFLFNKPQCKIASLIKDKIDKCETFNIVSGFITIEGIKSISEPIIHKPSKLKSLVIGAGTYRAFEAIDELIGFGVGEKNIFIHLGHTIKTTSSKAKHSFYRYHPMLHSKIILLHMPENQSCAFIGSHNITGFALLGLNGEAGVMVEGPSDASEFISISKHIEESKNQATQYTPSLKEAYSWWTNQYIDGLKAKSNDTPRDGENKKTVIIIATIQNNLLPKAGEDIYFEMPIEIQEISSMHTDIHLHIFQNIPKSPYAALCSLQSTKASFWCQTVGIEKERGVAELKADWYIANKKTPYIIPAVPPFRPNPSPGMQQIRIKIKKELYGNFEYYFDTPKDKWVPITDDNELLQLMPNDKEMVQNLNLVPQEHAEWSIVRGLQSEEKNSKYLDALYESSPESGSFILYSLRRRNKK